MRECEESESGNGSKTRTNEQYAEEKEEVIIAFEKKENKNFV